jgi:hypothetical protein
LTVSCTESRKLLLFQICSQNHIINHYSTKVLNPRHSKTKMEHKELNIHFSLTIESPKFSHVSHIKKSISRPQEVRVVKNHCSRGC